MLTSLRMLSLVCKCVFYRPQHNEKKGHSNFEILEVQKMKYISG